MSKYLIGSGGHASVIYDIAKRNNIIIDGVFVDKKEQNITDLPWVGKFDEIKNFGKDEFILAFGDMNFRMILEKKLTNCGFKWFSLVDKTAIIGSDVVIGKGTVVMPGAIINAGSVICNHVIINSGSIVEHGCNIDNHVHMSPRSVICGNVSVGEGTWIGAGATVINGINIGSNVIVGAGSTVINDIDNNEKVMGSPAKSKNKENNSFQKVK